MSTVSGADIMLTMPSRTSSVRIGIEPATYSKPSLSPSKIPMSETGFATGRTRIARSEASTAR